MGRWLEALRAKEKNTKTRLFQTDETDKTMKGEVLSVLAVPHRPISTKFFSDEAEKDCIVEITLDQVANSATCFTEATKGRQGRRTDLLDNIQEVPKAPTGTSIEAGLRSLQKAAASKSATPISPEKKTETAIMVTAKTDGTSFVSFVSSSDPHYHDFFLPDPAGIWTDAEWQDAFEERAAVLEYDGGWNRDAAESLARQYIDEQKTLRRSNP